MLMLILWKLNIIIWLNIWLPLWHTHVILQLNQLLSFSRNLQAAIGAYYDFESPNINAPCMSFVRDVTIGEGESVPPDTPFTKTWRIQNTGLLLTLITTDRKHS